MEIAVVIVVLFIVGLAIFLVMRDGMGGSGPTVLSGTALTSKFAAGPTTEPASHPAA